MASQRFLKPATAFTLPSWSGSPAPFPQKHMALPLLRNFHTEHLPLAWGTGSSVPPGRPFGGGALGEQQAAAGCSEFICRMAPWAQSAPAATGAEDGFHFLCVCLLMSFFCHGDRELFLCQHASRTPGLQHRLLRGTGRPLSAWRPPCLAGRASAPAAGRPWRSQAPQLPPPQPGLQGHGPSLPNH